MNAGKCARRNYKAEGGGLEVRNTPNPICHHHRVRFIAVSLQSCELANTIATGRREQQ